MTLKQNNNTEEETETDSDDPNEEEVPADDEEEEEPEETEQPPVTDEEPPTPDEEETEDKTTDKPEQAPEETETEDSQQNDQGPKQVVVKPTTQLDQKNKRITATVDTDDIEQVGNEETLIIKPEQAREQVELNVNLDTSIISKLTKNNNDLVIDKSDANLNIPQTILKQIESAADNKQVNIKLVKQEEPNALGSVYDFTITAGSKEINDFNGEEVTLTFAVNPTLIADLDPSEVKAFYFNEETKEWEVIGNSTFDQSKGIVTAKTTHFSTYGVFQYNNDHTSDEVLPTETHTADKNTDNENELPNTATNMYSLLGYGCIIMLAGLLIFFTQRKIRPNN
ncbi:hypothetical protein [Gracilibacillus massiliensis]|uniref:hypothetical protein n=1 Tax=Gracilibacillus massiliensis TaxID=1564956 RepID=UPI00071D658F|nr:hypothetical protein [Gracilibacillus massiliensis]